MKKIILPLLISTLYLIATAQPSKVAFVSTFESLTALQNNGDDDEIAAANWLVNTYGGVFIPVSQIKNNTVNLSEYKALWIHFDRQSDETTINNEFVASFLDNTVKNAINTFYKAGGNLLLSTYATRYVTDLGRYDLPIELKGFGNGDNNNDIWYASPTWGTFSGTPAVFNKITDPIYNGLIGITYVNRENGSSYPIIPLIGAGWKEDHNYFWNPQPDKANNDVWKYRDFENNWSANSLATWTHVQDYFGTAITRWLPRGDFQGKAITIGIGAYEWNQDSVTNPYQSNIKRLTKNALDELAPETKMSDYFQTSSSGNWNDINTWNSSTNGTKWYPATLTPTSSAALINVLNGHEVIISDNTTASILNIKPGGRLTLNKDKTLNIAGDFTVESSTAGTGTFVDLNTASGLTVNGNTSVQQYLANGRNWYVSSPVATALTNIFSGDVWSYNEPNTGTTQNPGSTIWDYISTPTTLSLMTGYVVHPTSTNIVSFTGGSLNSGEKSITINRTENGKVKRGFNLIGNPYPSYVNIKDAVTVNIEGSYWLRSKNSGNTAYVFDTYNLKSGIGTSLSGLKLTKNIPPMQAIWVRVKQGFTSGSVTFHNSLRSHQDSISNIFRSPSKNTESPSVLRLQVTNGINSDETVLYANIEASNRFDDFDSQKMTNGSVSIPEIYTIADGEQLAINGLNAIPYNTELPIGFSAGQSNIFTIKATQINGFDSNTQIILRDNEKNIEHDLSQGADYSFESDATSSTNRFSLLFKLPFVTTKNIENSLENECVTIFKNMNNQLTVSTTYDLSSEGGLLMVSNVVGQLLISQLMNNSINTINLPLTAGVYFITAEFKL